MPKLKKRMTREEEFELVFAIFRKWGWAIAVEDDADDPSLTCRGIIAGEVEYLDDLLTLQEPQKHFRSDEEAGPDFSGGFTPPH